MLPPSKLQALQQLFLAGYTQQSFCEHEHVTAVEDSSQGVMCTDCGKMLSCYHPAGMIDIRLGQCNQCGANITQLLSADERDDREWRDMLDIDDRLGK